ncbi:MAG: hypothetical protein E7616_05980 [Ruminococcaceae bacterium]|nr:hypothetical protein [Oscillospiraceae bacterium]
MKKYLSAVVVLILAILLLSLCGIWHNHTLGEWQYNGSGHFRECSCGYTISEGSSKHIDEDKNDMCDICRCSMKYEINSLHDLSWYLLYYYELSQYDYLQENNMKAHNIHDMNFKNTLTYNEKKIRVSFEEPYFNEYLTALPMHEEYVKSNTEYYSYYKASGYSQTDVPAKYYLFRTQENIRYGLSDRHCDYERFTETKSKFKTVNDFYETSLSSSLTKNIYKDSASYGENNLSFKNEIIYTVTNKISYFIRYYLNVEFKDYGEIVLPEMSYFTNFYVRTENDTVYFSIEKNDGKTFYNEDIRYSINGSINLKMHDLSYNVKESYYINGEIMYYVDYDYDLSLTNNPIGIEFDTNGEFEEVYIESH